MFKRILFFFVMLTAAAAVALAAGDAEVITKQEIPWGTIAISLAAIVIAILYTILALNGLAPGLQLKAGNKSLQISPRGRKGGSDTSVQSDPQPETPEPRTYPELDPKEDDNIVLAFMLTRRTYQVERDIEAEQQDLIDSEYRAFLDYVLDLRMGLDGDKMWSHIHDCLMSVVKNNHILHYVDVSRGPEAVDPSYLNKRIRFVRDRLMATGIAWGERLENVITTFIRLRLVRFAEVAGAKTRTLREDLEAFALSTANPSIKKLIQLLRKESGVD